VHTFIPFGLKVPFLLKVIMSSWASAHFQPHTWEFTLVLVEMPNRKTASLEQKNRPHQEMSQPSNGATTAQQTKWSSKKSAKINAKNGSNIASNHNGIVVKSVRRYQAPVVSTKDGCQSPILTGIVTRPRAMVSKSPKAPRLVGIELNPGPPKGMRAKAAQKKKAAQAS
jgi:hypothetical protein